MCNFYIVASNNLKQRCSKKKICDRKVREESNKENITVTTNSAQSNAPTYADIVRYTKGKRKKKKQQIR